MNKIKKQKFKEGAVVKIDLPNDKIVFGRLMPGIASKIIILDAVTIKDKLPSIDFIVSQPIIFYCGLYRYIITKGIFEIIGIKEFTEIEKKNMPAFFTQDLVNIDDCVIYWNDGRERKAKPQECLGLERSSVWDEKSLVERIEDHYAGKKNFHVEHQKVILSKDDPRYLAPPQALRWDFDKQEFYRTDR